MPKLVALVGALAILATPAQAAPDWELGLPEETTEESCFSIGNPDIVAFETNISTRAGMLIDPQDLPRIGEVFYGSVWIGQVRGCFDDAVAPEVLPPAGVELAISAANPVRCHSTPVAGGAQTPITAGCPQSPGPGLYGGRSLAPNGDLNQVWTMASGEIFVIEFPLRASRPLTGLPGGPSCPERANRTGPCPREAAGDFLQTPVKVLDSGFSPVLTPALGLFAVGGSGDAGLFGAPRAMKIQRALKGIRITVSVPSNGSTVTASLKARRLKGVKGGVIARAKRKRAQAGALRMRLRPSRRAARALRRKRTVTATLRVTVKPRRGAAVKASQKLTLRR